MSVELSTQQTRLLTAAIAALGSADFGHALLAFVRAVVDFNSAVLMAYPDDAKLLVLHDELDASDRLPFDGPYRNGLYLLSPLYIESHAGRRGYFHISEIAPEGFTDSEYYELYYSTNGCIDQVAFLVESGNGTPVALSLERTEQLPTFSDAEKAKLAGLTSLVDTLIRQQHWPDAQIDTPVAPLDMHAHMQQVMSLFGSSTLTPRERDVVRLILRGYPSKSVARELDISTQTEQVHRKNIYQKLGISSHSELFTLFFDAIAQPTVDADPLLALRA
ncbi:MAG: LuxR C-terminal-related transcriptional regulator [Halieaceae bacterium]